MSINNKVLPGKRFGNLTVVKKTEETKNSYIIWQCICDCGKEYFVRSVHLTRKVYPVKSCGCQKIRFGPRHHQWTGCGEISGAWWASHILRQLVNGQRRSKHEVTIDIKYGWELFLKQNRKCALSGEDIYFPKVNGEMGTASLDRIDSSKGYIQGNVQWVHKHINLMKNRLTQDRFIEMCKKVVSRS